MQSSIYGVPMPILESVIENKETTVEDKVFGVNLLFNIADEDMSTEDIVNSIMFGTLPKYVELKTNRL